MARSHRIQYPGAIYHVIARSDGGKIVFEIDDDRRVFLNRLGEVCGSCDWRMHAFQFRPGRLGGRQGTRETNRHDQGLVSSGDAIRKQRCDFLDVLCGHIGSVELEFFHGREGGKNCER